MASLNRSKNSPALKSDTTQQATLVSGEDVAMQSKSNRIPLENISNDEVEVEKEETKKKASRGRKTMLSGSNGNPSVNNLPSFFRGGASSKATSTSKSAKEEDDEVAAVAAAATSALSKQPIDPPGALWHPSSKMYDGGNHPSLQPVGLSMPMWGPPPHQEGGGRWASMPPFLAPLAATVRHPFSHFVPNGQGHFPYWQQQQQQHHHQGGNDDEEFGTPMEAEMEAETRSFTAVDTTMKDDDDASTESDPSNKVVVADVQPTALPSMFAPQECVDKIRAKVNAGQAHVVQTRSMTAKSRSTKSSKQKVSPIAAHQASSPPSTKDNGKGLFKTAMGDDTPVEVMTILGKTIHMIDAERKVFVIDLLSPEACDEIRMMADNHTRDAKKDAEVWRTLYTYTKMDLPVVEVKDMVSKYTDGILDDVKKIVGVIFGMRREAMRLRPRSWKEPHLLLYQALDDKPRHTGIEMHYDGCDVTWQAMLTRQDEYEGGGTYFRCLRKTIRLKQGQVLVHPGELYHKGIDITYGVRCLLVCFTDGFSPKIFDDSKQEDDDPKYESNVLIC